MVIAARLPTWLKGCVSSNSFGNAGPMSAILLEKSVDYASGIGLRLRAAVLHSIITW